MLYWQCHICIIKMSLSVVQNMFLAIINDTYSEVKAEIAAKKVAYDIGDYLKRGNT